MTHYRSAFYTFKNFLSSAFPFVFPTAQFHFQKIPLHSQYKFEHMSKVEQKQLLTSMRKRTAEATKSKEAAVKYLAKLGVLTANGNYTKSYSRVCIKNKAA